MSRKPANPDPKRIRARYGLRRIRGRLWRPSAAEEAWIERWGRAWADAMAEFDAMDLDELARRLAPRPTAEGPTPPSWIPVNVVEAEALASAEPVLWLSQDFRIVSQAEAVGFVETGAIRRLWTPAMESIGAFMEAATAPDSFGGDVFKARYASGAEREAACERLARRFADHWMPQTWQQKALARRKDEEGAGSFADLKFRLMRTAVWLTVSLLDAHDPVKIRIGNHSVSDVLGEAKGPWRDFLYVWAWDKVFQVAEHCVAHDILEIPEDRDAHADKVESVDELRALQEGTPGSEWLATEANDPLVLLVQKEQADAVLAALDRLPSGTGQQTRELLTLLADGKSVAEAARELGISADYGRQLRKRAKDHVEKRIHNG